MGFLDHFTYNAQALEARIDEMAGPVKKPQVPATEAKPAAPTNSATSDEKKDKSDVAPIGKPVPPLPPPPAKSKRALSFKPKAATAPLDSNKLC